MALSSFVTFRQVTASLNGGGIGDLAEVWKPLEEKASPAREANATFSPISRGLRHPKPDFL